MGNLKPAAIQITLECLQESTRQSGIFFLLLSYNIHGILESDSLSQSTPSVSIACNCPHQQNDLLELILIKCQTCTVR